MRGNCVICTSRFARDNCAALLCGHTFHLTCILQWLEHSKTCPHCRVKTNERLVVRQLFFDTEEVTADGQSSVVAEDGNGSTVNLDSRVYDLEVALDTEKTEHMKAKEALNADRKELEKLHRLLKQEKDKGKEQSKTAMDLRDHISCLERALQDNQDAKRQVDKYRARLRAAEFYKLLMCSSVDDADKAIDNYVGDSGDLDGPKFLSLIRRQLEDTKRRLNEANQRAQQSDNRTMELEGKVKRLSKLVAGLREEVNVHRGSSKCTPYNPSLKDVLADTPESSERSLLESQIACSPLTFGQQLVEPRPRPSASVRHRPPPVFSLLEESSLPAPASTEDADMSLHVALPGRYHLPTTRRRSPAPTLSTSDGLGGHRKPLSDVTMAKKRPLEKKPSINLKKHKSNEIADNNRRISSFFVRKPTSSSHVIFLD